MGPPDVPRLDQPIDGLAQLLGVGEGAGLVAVGPIILLPDLLYYITILQSSMLYVANVAMIIAWKYAKDTKDESIKLVDQNDEAFNC